MPVVLVGILVFGAIIIDAVFSDSPNAPILITYGVFGIIYTTFNYISTIRLIVTMRTLGLLNAAVTGIGLGIAHVILPVHISELTHMLIPLGLLGIAATSGRSYAYLALAGFVLFTFPDLIARFPDTEALLEFLTPILIAVAILEVVSRVQETTIQQIHRLQTINRISRQITQSLDTEKTLALLDSAMQEALQAETYFIGILENGQITLKLFFDDGEYFNDEVLPLKGTLSGWVIKNQRELYLPDLRDDVDLEGVELIITGQDRASLSWIAVPLKTDNITGVLGLASYTANAFDRADLELLTSLGQHVTIALDNTIRHAKVEKQAQLDSLTGVYNHGHFLKILEEHAQDALQNNTPLSLIMLDIDYFKRYNDSFGHLVGDRVLNTLCAAILKNIKHTDAVGRWGGEEFVISLPGARGKDAIMIAERISRTMAELRIEDRNQRVVPIPTISQGISVFGQDADEIFDLIDAADRRLYVAKDSGGNRVKPSADFWDQE